MTYSLNGFDAARLSLEDVRMINRAATHYADLFVQQHGGTMKDVTLAEIAGQLPDEFVTEAAMEKVGLARWGVEWTQEQHAFAAVMEVFAVSRVLPGRYFDHHFPDFRKAR